MGYVAIHAARKSGGAPTIQNFPIESAASFKQGSPVARDGTNTENIEEHAGGATVTGLLGFATVGVSAGLPEAKGDTPYGTRIPVEMASDDEVDWIGMLLNADAIVTPDPAVHEGVSYGLIKHSVDGWWGVDEADTTDVHVRVIKCLPEVNCVLFKVLPSVIGL